MILQDTINEYLDLYKYHGHLRGKSTLEVLEELSLLASKLDDEINSVVCDEVEIYRECDQEIIKNHEERIKSLEKVIRQAIECDEIIRSASGYTRLVRKNMKDVLNG